MNDDTPAPEKPPEQTPKKAVPKRTTPTFHKSWWPGWIWGIPVAAVGIVLWLSLRALSTSGTDIKIVFDQAAGMSPGDTHVMYRGLEVGSLVDVHLDHSGHHVLATFNIDDSVKRWLDTGTHFYLEGTHPSLSNPASLKAIIAGPSVVMVPGKGTAARRFVGITGRAPRAFQAIVRYHLQFKGAVGELDVGAPVTLRGFTVGDVVAVSLAVNPDTGEISTPVTIELDPTRFHLGRANPADDNWAPLLDAVLQHMVANGLRATLTQDPPIIGARQVALKTLPKLPPATLVANANGRPGIPTASTSGGPAQLLAKIDQLPITAIADNVRSITAHVEDLVGSPELRASLDHLNDTLAALDKTVHAAGPQIAPTIRSLRDTAKQIDATAKAARRLTGGSPAAADGNVRQALKELTQAARSIRSLADYLQRHPNALITGR